MQPQVWTDTNWTLIFSIVVGSAVLAYLGDVLGLKYGKQRISIFGLRPKHTSRLITAMTGMFISVVVLAVMAFFSESVRTALFTLKNLNQQINVLRVQLMDSNAELSVSRERLQENQVLLQTTALSLDITRFDFEALRNDRNLLFSERNDLEAVVTSLRDESEELKRDLERMRLGTITVQANTLLAQKVVLPGSPRAQVLEILADLEENVKILIAAKRSENRAIVSSDVKLSLDLIEESDIVTRLTDMQERFFVRALAAENLAMGEEIKVRFETGRSYLLYDEGETLYRKLVNPDTPSFNAEDALHLFLRELKNHALRNGVLPDPATNSVGSLEGEDFFETVEKLNSITLPTIINAVALQEIYTEGPVRIKIVLE